MSQITLVPRAKLSGILNLSTTYMSSCARRIPTDYTVNSEEELMALQPDRPMVTVRLGDEAVGLYVAENGDRAYLWPCRSNAIATALLPEEEMAVLQPKVKQCYVRQTGAQY